jgi:hypothetical protein
MNIHKKTLHNGSPDAVFAVLTSTKFIEANEKMRGALEVKVREVSRSDDRLVIELDTLEHAKGITGVDRTKTTRSKTRQEWDLKRRSGTWSYADEQQPRVKVGGTHRVEAEGDKARLVSEVMVEINIPLIGGKISEILAREFDKGWVKFERLVNEHLAAAGSAQQQ